MVSMRVAALLMACTASSVSAAGFLHSGSKLRKEEVQSMLLSELSAASTDRVESMRIELSPIFEALPKNEFGQLEPSAVRYAIHRLFVHKYGWVLKGLEPEVDNASESSAHAEILKDRVPHYIEGLFAEKMHRTGLELNEVAVFAATLNDLIEKNMVDGFLEVFEALDLNPQSVAGEAVDEVLAGFTARFIKDESQPIEGRRSVRTIQRDVSVSFGEWPEVVSWLEDMRHTVEELSVNPFRDTSMYTRDDAVDVLKAVMHRIVEVANYGCPAMKSELVEMEYKGTGRIRIKDYFTKREPETLAYLRNIGALDETDPAMPMVIIANYVQSKGNCLVDADYYSLCCRNECEGLFRQLELKLHAPAAAPSRIAEIVSALASDTVDAPRNLSAALLNRLEQIADYHGGVVPLHGRLFTQWMHHAYPRECAYPHLNKTKALSQDEWLDLHHVVDVYAQSSEVRRNTERADHFNDVSEDSLPWHMMEDLVVDQPKASGKSFGAVRVVVALVALVSMAMPLLRTSVSLLPKKHVSVMTKAHMV